MEKVFSPKLFGLIKDGSVKKNLSKDILTVGNRFCRGLGCFS